MVRRRWFGVLVFALSAALAGAQEGSGQGVETLRKQAQLQALSQERSYVDFELQALRSDQQRLSAYEGQVVLLNFWASWCAPCREEMPSMQELYETLDEEQFEIVAVNVREGRSTVEEFVRDPESYRVLVPIANPRTESGLVELACTLASTREKGTVHVAHVVQAPKQSSAADDRRQRDRIVEESSHRLEDIERIGDQYDVTFETSTIVSHRSFEEVFDRANRTRPDLVLMNWEKHGLWASARAERPLAELTNQLPADFLVVKDRGGDCSRMLVPTAGGPASDLSADIARGLCEATGGEITLLHVADPGQQEAGEAFLSEWAEGHDLADADRVVDDSGDIEGAIERAARDHTMVMLGATEQGILARLVTDSLHLNVVDDVDGTVLLTERETDRSLTERLFGAGRRNK